MAKKKTLRSGKVAKKKKKKSPPKIGCDCITLLNTQLSEHNAYVDTKLQMNMKTGEGRHIICIPLSKIESKNRTRLPTLVCTFCPICGRKIDPILQEPGKVTKQEIAKRIYDIIHASLEMGLCDDDHEVDIFKPEGDDGYIDIQVGDENWRLNIEDCRS